VFRRHSRVVDANVHRAGEHEAATLRSAIEVAAVKAQVQQIVRRLHLTLDELETEIERLPDDGETPPEEDVPEEKPDDAEHGHA